MSEPSDGGGQGSGRDAGYEVTDVRIAPLVQFGAFLAIISAVIFVAMSSLFGYFETRETRLNESDLPLAVGERGRNPQPKPPAPRLEGIDLEYGKTRARLDSPHSRAMSEVEELAVGTAMKELENRLPVRADYSGEPDRLPSDSNSGRGNPKETQ